ncbi:GNAT family N-acetyltransferase [Microcoleus sp. FACHB-672]|nr:GNAT family N-acetyltransferase [Microcoleus sp. FACHB-672]
MPQESISPVNQEDFPRIVKVWEASVRETHRFLSEADIQFFKPLISNELPHIADLVCVRDEADQVAGFVGVAEGKVEMLFIHPIWRRQGIGRQLLDYAVKRLGATKVDVNEQNEEALEFYKRMGFEVEGRSELDSTGRPFPLLHMHLGKVA